MRRLLVVSLGALSACTPAGTPHSDIPADEQIWDYLTTHGKAMVQVTPQPYRVNWRGSALCERPNTVVHSPHGEHWIHVRISAEAAPILKTGKGTYPVGTLILKEKFKDAAGKVTDFFTGMRKRETGYNPDAGDWEYFLLEGQGDQVIARGKIASCIDCHANFADTDFVSRRYLTQPADREPR